MKKFSYHKKYHYLLKYFIMAFPLICVILISFMPLYEIISHYGDSDYVILTQNYYINTFATAFDITFSDNPLNAWYYDLMYLIMGENFFDNIQGSAYLNILALYPLYILWVYIMDLILDIFAMVPKLAHKLLYKLGGGIDD